jgi:uncharacterized membrane protein YedE/YeeE
MNRSQLSAFIVGLIFGIGLLLAGMANPAKVLAFLDLAGDWDPSLALVMVGAIAVASVGFALTKGRHLAWSGDPIQIPGNRKLDVGFNAILARIGCPDEMPPRTPPAWFDRNPSGVNSSRCSVPFWSTHPKPAPISTPFTALMLINA